MGIFGIGESESSSEHIPGCYTLANVPGRTIIHALGLVQFTRKGVAGDVPKLSGDFFRGVLDAAKNAGGNAVINVRLESGAYEKQGAKWVVSFVVAYGDAVVLE